MEVGIDGQDKDFIEGINEAMFKKKMVDRVVEKALAGKEKGWEQLAQSSGKNESTSPRTRNSMKI